MIEVKLGARNSAGRDACVATLFATMAVTILFTSNLRAQTCDELFAPSKGPTYSNGVALKAAADARELKTIITKEPMTDQPFLMGFVPIRDGRELYVDYVKPEPGKPTIVLLNGLTYRFGIWDAFVNRLKGEGLGILRYDPMGMGKTMEKYGIPDGPIELIDQAKDLDSLLNALAVPKQVHLLGLSYGGGLAIMYGGLHPERIASLILEAPLTGPLPKLESDIQMKIDMTRVWQPWNKATDAELYSFFLKMIVYGQYPLTEPIVLEHPYKLENVFRMTEGTKSFRAADYVKRLPAGKVHLMVADKDQYIPAPILDAFWNSIPKAARASRIFVENSEHKIPEAMPHFSAEWIKLIIAEDKRLQDGTTWTGGVWKGGAVATGKPKIEIDAP